MPSIGGDQSRTRTERTCLHDGESDTAGGPERVSDADERGTGSGRLRRSVATLPLGLGRQDESAGPDLEDRQWKSAPRARSKPAPLRASPISRMPVHSRTEAIWSPPASRGRKSKLSRNAATRAFASALSPAKNASRGLS